jgi:hypothetical protein
LFCRRCGRRFAFIGLCRKRRRRDCPTGRGGFASIKPYFVLGVASTLTAVILMFALGEQVSSAGGALLAGYAWDSTLQKLAKA